MVSNYMNIPYTYLIGWKQQNKWYYGIRYAKNCNPNDLWKKYFTSSIHVKRMREIYGDPDVIEIRKTFSCSKKAKKWEDKVLSRLKVNSKDKWLNLTTNYSFRGVNRSWNEGLTKETSPSLLKLSETLKKLYRENKIKKGKNKGFKYDLNHKIKNSWNQIKKNNPNLIFNNYEDLKSYCISKYNEGLGIWTIGKEIGLDGSTIKTILKHSNIEVKPNQSMSKILKRLPNFKFKNYKDFCLYCKKRIEDGALRWHLVKELNLSECTIQRALDQSL